MIVASLLYLMVVLIFILPALITASGDFGGTDEAYAIALLGVLFWPVSILIITGYGIFKVYMLFKRLYDKYSEVIKDKLDNGNT